MIDISLWTSYEKDAIKELRKRVENVMPLDMVDDRLVYYRFLKARDFNLDKAEKMLSKHILWRKHHQISALMENFKPEKYFIEKIEPRLIGYDKEGDLVAYTPTGNFDARDVLKCTKINDYMKHWFWFGEKLATILKQQRKEGENKSPQVCLIIDLNRLTLANVTSKSATEISLRVLGILQDNYPESIKNIYVINSPPYYVIIYNLIKRLMSAAFRQKFQVYGSVGWKEKLLEAIDAEILPAFMGGKRTDPDGDPLCRTFICHGGWMPKCYYLTDEDRGFKDKSRVTNITVFSSSKEDIHFDVTDEDSVIQWEFLVKDKDIGFGLYFQDSDNILEEILPVLKYDTIDGVEIGSCTAVLTGKYIITFDNSYSRFHSKKVAYCITVLKNKL